MAPLSPYQPMAYGQLGMGMGEMMQYYMAPRGIPQVGGLFGQSGQQVVNMAYPLLQDMMRQQMMQQGIMPMFPGAGAPFQQMQRFNFQDTLRESMKLARAQDLPMLSRRAEMLAPGVGGDVIRGIGNIPLLSNMIMPQLSQMLMPEGTRQDLTRAIVASSRGSIQPTDVNKMAGMLFKSLSTAEGTFDIGKTGGLGAGQVGEMMFEMQRRGFTNVFNDQTLGEIGGKGGLSAGRATMVKSKLTQLGDVLGMMDEMLGGNAPLSKILDSLESLSGKNIMAPGANVSQMRSQIVQMSSMANVLGIAPQAMMAMAHGTAMNLQAQGMGRGLSIPMTIHQMTMTTAGQLGQGFTGLGDMPGFDQTGADYGRGAGILTSRGLRSPMARTLGALSFINQQGLGGAALQNFFNKSPAERAAIFADRESRERLLANTGADTRILQGVMEDPDAARYLAAQGGGFATIMAGQALEFRADLRDRLERNRFTQSEINGVMRNLATGTTITPFQRGMLAGVNKGIQESTGVDVITLAGLLGGKASEIFPKIDKMAELAGKRGELLRDLMQSLPGGMAKAMAGANTFEDIFGALTGVQGVKVAQLRDMAEKAEKAGDPHAAKTIRSLEEALVKINDTMDPSSDAAKKKYLEAETAFNREFPMIDISPLAMKYNLTPKQIALMKKQAEMLTDAIVAEDPNRPSPEKRQGIAIGKGIVEAVGGLIGKIEFTLNIPQLSFLQKVFLILGANGGARIEGSAGLKGTP